MIKRIFQYTYLVLLLAIVGWQSPVKSVAIDLSEITITDIHKAYSQGKYNSRQLVEAYLEQIEKADNKINAISSINPDVLSIADLLDEEFKITGKLRPLHGIPIIVKDNINTKGLPTTAGALALRDFFPDEDAFIIKKLVKAGAIILGKSNMAEWAFSPRNSESSTVGTTRNPYNLEHVPAGSSGGTAAAVAANLCAAGLGTDTGNSIRGPSSHCALVGFRTTLGLISRSAIVPLYLRNDVVGPMCRTVKDAVKIMEVMVGYDPEDPVTNNSAGKIPENYQQFLQKDGLKGARIAVLRELSDNDIDPEIKILFEKAISDLKKLGSTIIDPLVIPDFSTLRQNQWCADFRKDVEVFLSTYVKRDTMKTLEDIIRVGSKSESAKRRLAHFEKNNGRSQQPEIDCTDPYTDPLRIAFRNAIEKRMDDLKLDAIIFPSWNHKPGKIGEANDGYKGDNSQIISPHTGQPGFTVPMGFTGNNLPAGLQFLGRMYSEPVLIKLVYAYEQGTRHRKPVNKS